ncbi:MAG: DUF4026 domain-containing protein [Planctomycetota bacterium]
MRDEANPYIELVNDPPAAMLAAILEGEEPESYDAIVDRLEETGCEVVEIASSEHAFPWMLEAKHPDGSALLAPGGSPEPLVSHASSPELRAAVEAATWTLTASAPLGEEPLDGYQSLMRLLYAAAPDAVGYADTDSLTVHPYERIADLASSTVPPSPKILFQVHAVFDDEGDDDTPVWMHTHGLHRCGSIELDVVGVPRCDAELYYQVINTAATMMIEYGPPPPDDPFTVARGLDVVWLPWEDSMAHVDDRALGGPDDRDDEDHTTVRGVLFVPGRGMLGGRKYKSLTAARSTLADNPVFWVSGLETDRMSALAKVRFDRLRALFDRYGAETEEWHFVVKLGYEVDGDEEEVGREHLWFEVHGVDGDEVDGTLLNQPHNIARMSEGQRARHDIARLSDWTVYSPHGAFTADTIGTLEAILEETA